MDRFNGIRTGLPIVLLKAVAPALNTYKIVAFFFSVLFTVIFWFAIVTMIVFSMRNS